MAAPTRRLQAPKGTRDWYPIEMSIRRHVEAAWRSASVDCGFEEIDGPTFELLELYTVKSGEGIVNELFSFTRAGGDDVYALRPEFTPTLARMVAARAAQLPQPIRWYCLPSMFRAERPQRGRLREFLQWNVDLIGGDAANAPDADADTIATAVLALERLGLRPEHVVVRISHREAVGGVLVGLGVAPDRLSNAFDLLDRREKLEPVEFAARAAALGLTADGAQRFDAVSQAAAAIDEPIERFASSVGAPAEGFAALAPLRERLLAMGLGPWCRWDCGIVRGLAYYTGTVFEIHERSGAERAIAGGGRYDGLVQLFGGPAMPACGFGMGDVVLTLVLKDRGLLPDAESGALLPRPDVFLVSAGSDEVDRRLPGLAMELRRAGLHVRRSYKATRNVGKLLGEAAKQRARYAAILDERLAAGVVVLKDLDGGGQREVPLVELVAAVSAR